MILDADDDFRIYSNITDDVIRMKFEVWTLNFEGFVIILDAWFGRTEISIALISYAYHGLKVPELKTTGIERLSFSLLLNWGEVVGSYQDR